MTRTILCTIALVATVLSLGCSGTIAHFTVISNRDVDLSALDRPVMTQKSVQGDSSRLTQLLIFPTFMAPSIGEAVDNALEAGKGDLLINATVVQEVVWIPYLLSVETITVEGTVVDTRGSGGPR